MRLRQSMLAPLLTIVACVLLTAAAHAWTYGDTLTVVWRPLPNLPALVQRGSTFPVWANAAPSVSGWTASLRFGALSIATPLTGGFQPTKNRWEFSALVPAGTPEEMYDFVLTSSSTPPDTSRHSVKVVPAIPTDYYFAQVSDTHLPAHPFSSGGSINTADTTGMGDFQAVIEDLNAIHPQFILHTGDFVNEGELEEYLAMYEMGRAQAMLSRLRDPIFVATGNHDIGGWIPTAPPDGTARKNWWRQFGWPFLLNPPAGDPYHSQDFYFDYGGVRVIGLEAYINSGSYDHYRQDLWGAQSFTAEQMSRLSATIAGAPPGSSTLAFYHYDFGGTLGNGDPGPNFSQINPAALGLEGAIWGHNHGVAEGNLAARPFNLGLRAVIDGRRTFRIFRVSNGEISPGPMHRTGGTSQVPTDSLTIALNGANDGTRSALTATVVNRYAETWEHARLVFNMVDHDSAFTATGGTIAQSIRQGGMVNVYVDCVLAAGATTIVTVQASTPVTSAPPSPFDALELRAPAPNPFTAVGGALRVAWSQPSRGAARVEVFDLQGARVATLFDGTAGPGEANATWDGRGEDGTPAPPAVYLMRLSTSDGVRSRRVVLMR